MFLPVGAAFGPFPTGTTEFRPILARPIEFRPLTKWTIPLLTVITRTRKSRTFLAAAIVAFSVKAWLVKIPSALAGRTGIASRPVIALLPRFLIATVVTTIRATAEILARTTRKFPFAIARRAITVRPIAARTVTVLAEAFTARRVRPLLTAAVPRRIGPLVAEFLLGKTGGRTGIATFAVAARRAVVAIVIRAIAARRIRTLLATAIIARAKILPRFTIRTIAARTVVPVEPRRTRPVAKLAARRIVVVAAAERAAFALTAKAALGAIARSSEVLAAKAALGEFLLGSAGGAGTALPAPLPAGGPITPAARGIVVFVAVAGHEGSH
jgi:hypothetical protein